MTLSKLLLRVFMFCSTCSRFCISLSICLLCCDREKLVLTVATSWSTSSRCCSKYVFSPCAPCDLLFVDILIASLCDCALRSGLNVKQAIRVSSVYFLTGTWMDKWSVPSDACQDQIHSAASFLFILCLLSLATTADVRLPRDSVC